MVRDLLLGVWGGGYINSIILSNGCGLSFFRIEVQVVGKNDGIISIRFSL